MRRPCAAGFTLVEVLVATGILVTVAAGTAQLCAIAIRHDVAARQRLVMSAAAAAKLDELAGTLAGAGVPSRVTGALDRAADGCADVTTLAGVSFERRWIVAPLSSYSPTAVVVAVRVIPASALAGDALELATIAEAAR